jgi:NADPH-dependent curcumin reductase CurA
MITSREIRLKSRPVGMPSADNFELVTVSVPRPAPGEVQVQNLWMTVDPYMRNRMAHRASYAASSPPGEEVHGGAIGEIAASNSTMYGWRPPFQLGEALQGGAIGEVAASDDPRFKPGDLVSSWFGWRELVQRTCRNPAEARYVRAPAPGIPGSCRHARADGLGRLAQDRNA